MKLKEILDMSDYLQTKCYCPGEVYSLDGFFYQIFKDEDEYKLIGKCEKENVLTADGCSFIAVISGEESPQVLVIIYKEDNIIDIVRFDATENNIKLVKEVIETQKTTLKLDEYIEGSTMKDLNEIFEIADCILID